MGFGGTLNVSLQAVGSTDMATSCFISAQGVRRKRQQRETLGLRDLLIGDKGQGSEEPETPNPRPRVAFST